MHGSDVVDLVAEVLPRFWREFSGGTFIAVMTVFDWRASAAWYVMDKGASIAESALPMFDEIAQTFAC